MFSIGIKVIHIRLTPHMDIEIYPNPLSIRLGEYCDGGESD